MPEIPTMNSRSDEELIQLQHEISGELEKRQNLRDSVTVITRVFETYVAAGGDPAQLLLTAQAAAAAASDNDSEETPEEPPEHGDAP